MLPINLTPPSLRLTGYSLPYPSGSLSHLPYLSFFILPPPALRGTPSILEGEFGYSVRKAFAEASASKTF